MAKTAELKIPSDIEYRVIGNMFCLLISVAGLLAGEMVRLRSFDYWLNDLIPLLLLTWSGFGCYRNFLSTMIAYHDVLPPEHHSAPNVAHIHGEPVIAGHISSKPGMSTDKVLEQVAKRIETQKADALKRNKFTN
ncbi:MAG: hypothetical protein PHY09_11825 [Desulfuromonadaceae bacterium]|nr:hypothetical protein [Desulfuromonadaceae bacterium]MDD5105316.1 hypothetical protein [Desulfuromonadaceae bacterium]